MKPRRPRKFSPSLISRRRLLKSISATALAAALTPALSRAFAPAPSPAPVPPRALPFPLTQVRLLEGPFLAAQKRDEKYLLQLEPDRMLCNFRINAGLQPKAPVYGGWESVQTWADVRAHGHTLGHYLTACSLMFASTSDDAFKKRCDYIVADLKECQEAGKGGGMGDGLICAFPDKTAQIENLLNGRRVIGVPWYTLHKIFAGLRDAHLYCQSPHALDVLVKLSDWAFNVTKDLTDAQFERMLNTEHGGMNEVLADVSALTGQQKYLDLAQRFSHKFILDPLSQSRDTLDGPPALHSNTQIPKIIGFHRIHTLTGDPKYLAASQFFWKTVTSNRSFATGGNGDNEHFFPPAQFDRHIPSAKTMETCCSHNMLKLTRALFTQEPSAAYADFYERALYNTILASQDPDSGMMTYFQSTRPGYLKLFCTPFDSFWCCTGTGIENHAKYGDSIYFHTPDNTSLFVNLFIPSTLTWKEKNLTLTQATKFPETGKTRLEITAPAPVELTLHLRHPAWCKTATITINGTPVPMPSTPGSYIALKGNWKTGDIIELDLPMSLHTELLPNTKDMLAFLYGPIVLVGNLGTEGIAPGAQIHINERTIGNDLNPPATLTIPTLTGDIASMPEKIKPADTPLTFKSNGLAKPTDIALLPYYQAAHIRYNMYWKVT